MKTERLFAIILDEVYVTFTLSFLQHVNSCYNTEKKISLHLKVTFLYIVMWPLMMNQPFRHDSLVMLLPIYKKSSKVM